MKKITYQILTFIFIVSACTEPFYPELDSTHIRLVVQGSISDVRTAHQVSLTKSADYFSNAPASKVTGATVSINDGESTFILTEISDGLYETDTMAGEVGKTYTLTINSEGETYTASSDLNYCAPIDSINFGYYNFGAFEEEEVLDSNGNIVEPYVAVLLNAMEPEPIGDYYLFHVYKNNVLESDTLDEINLTDDYFINGFYMYDVTVQWVENVIIGDTITLEMQAITEGYYDYLNQLLTTIYNLGPLGGPPANPVGNVNNGAMGFFIAYSKVQMTRIIPEKDKWIELEW